MRPAQRSARRAYQPGGAADRPLTPAAGRSSLRTCRHRRPIAVACCLRRRPDRRRLPSPASRSPARSGRPPPRTAAPRKSLAGKVILIDPGHNVNNWMHPGEINRPVFYGIPGATKPCDTTGTATAERLHGGPLHPGGRPARGQDPSRHGRDGRHDPGEHAAVGAVHHRPGGAREQPARRRRRLDPRRRRAVKRARLLRDRPRATRCRGRPGAAPDRTRRPPRRGDAQGLPPDHRHEDLQPVHHGVPALRRLRRHEPLPRAQDLHRDGQHGQPRQRREARVARRSGTSPPGGSPTASGCT